MQAKEQILFYGKTNPEDAFLSNFYLAPFRVSGVLYSTNEHFFQSKKFEGQPEQQKIIDCKTPKQAKSLGRKLKMLRPQNWDEVKQKIMLCGLRAKFAQNEDLKKKLLQTGNKTLREHTHRDNYWADGGKKFIGKNRLGVLLMQVRLQLIQAEKKEPKQVNKSQ